MLIASSRSLASSPLPSWLWSFSPSGLISVTVAVAISMMAIALFSCSVANAVVPSGDTAIYSGSRSLATVSFVISGKSRTPSARSCSNCPLKLVKSAVLTAVDVSISPNSPETSIMLIEPSGSTTLIVSPSPSTTASPSFATNTFDPSGVKVTISGSAPTTNVFTKSEILSASRLPPPATKVWTPVRSTTTTTPLSVVVSASSATASRSFPAL